MIDFRVEDVAMPELDFKKVGIWINEVAGMHDRTLGNVVYCFCSDEYMLEANRKYLGHDYYTDIITFDYTHRNKISGDIYISLDRVADNANEVGAPYETELKRVIIHGILHLCGISDKGEGEREIMEAAEDDALARFPR